MSQIECLIARNPRDPKIGLFQFFTVYLGPGRYLDGFVRHFSSRYTPSDPKFIILDPQNIKKLGLGFRVWGDFRETSPILANPNKAFYNIQPFVEPRKTRLFHDIWSPFWHLFLADSIPGGAWESPWDHPGSTFASKPRNPAQVPLFWPSFWDVFWTHFLCFFDVFSKWVFQRPLDHSFLIFSSFQPQFWSNFCYFLKMLKTLKN